MPDGQDVIRRFVADRLSARSINNKFSRDKHLSTVRHIKHSRSITHRAHRLNPERYSARPVRLRKTITIFKTGLR